MPISTQSMLSQLRPLSAIDIGDFGNAGAERQKLRLMREQFEETKRRHLEDERLRALSEAGEMRRAEMATERQRQQAEATAAEKRRAERATAYSDFYKAQDANDIAGMAAAGNRLREFGGLYEELAPDEQGRPRFRVGMEGEAYNKRRAERDAVSQQMKTQAPEGSVWLPPDVAQQATISRLNALGLGNLDNENVVELGKQMDTRREQTAPVLEALQGSRPPGAYRDSSANTGEAALRLGLSPLATMDTYHKLQGQSDAALGKELDAARDVEKTELQAERDRAKEERAAERAQAVQAQKLEGEGYDEAEAKWNAEGLNKRSIAQKAAEQIIDMLSNDNHLDDKQITHQFVLLKGSIGPQSNQEIAGVFDTDDASFAERLVELVRNGVFGGQGSPMRKTIIDIVNRSLELEDDRALSYLDSLAGLLESPNLDEGRKRGIRAFRDSVGDDLLDAWNEERKDKGLPTFDELDAAAEEQAPMRGQNISDEGSEQPRVKADLHEGITADDEFMDVFTEHAINAGIDPELVLPLISHESGGDPQARNAQSGASGLIQFLDSTARRYGFESAEEFGKLSAAEQAPYIVQYLVDSGVTAEHDQGDIYVAISAPAALNESDDFRVYEKGTDAYRMNQTWDLDNDGVITRGELYRWGMGERRGKGKKSDDAETKPAKKPTAKAGRDDDESLLE